MHKKTLFILQHQSEIIIENRLNTCLFAFKNHKKDRNLVQNSLGGHICSHGNTNCKSCLLIFVSKLSQLCTCLYIIAKTKIKTHFLSIYLLLKITNIPYFFLKMTSVAIFVAMTAQTVHNVY